MTKSIPIGVSPRHVHLSKEHFLQLFGQGSFLTKRKDLSQPGQFAAEQTVTLATSLNKMENVRILGPFREYTQVELAYSDAVILGLNPPVRDSGDHQNTPGITIIGPNGVVDIAQGVILAQRHIHMTPADAREFGMLDKDLVWVAVKSPYRLTVPSASRNTIFGEVLIRVHPNSQLDFHLDTDEANSAGVINGDLAFIVSDFTLDKSSADQFYPRKRLYSEWDVRKAKKEGKLILLEKSTLLTPSAKDYGNKWKIFKRD